MALPTRVTASITTSKWEAYIDFGEPLSSADRNQVHGAVTPSTRGISSTRFQRGGSRLTMDIAHPSRTPEQARELVREVIRALSLDLQGEIIVH